MEITNLFVLLVDCSISKNLQTDILIKSIKFEYKFHDIFKVILNTKRENHYLIGRNKILFTQI